MCRVLLVSFEPFGLSGRFVRKANAGHDLVEILKANLQAQEYESLQLPVSDDAVTFLHRRQEEYKPDAVLCLGEDMGLLPGTIALEPYAYDTCVRYNPFARTGDIPRIMSPFAQSVAPGSRSTVGLYYCNAVYRQALLWAGAQVQNVPTAFVHVSVLGDRHKQAHDVMALIDKLRQYTINQKSLLNTGPHIV